MEGLAEGLGLCTAGRIAVKPVLRFGSAILRQWLQMTAYTEEVQQELGPQLLVRGVVLDKRQHPRSEFLY